MKQKFIDFLIGKEIPSYGYNIDRTVALLPDGQKQDFVQGLNRGDINIAKMQDELGIVKPQTKEEIALANSGQFNKPEMVRQGGLVRGYNQGYNLNYDNPTNTVGTRIGQALGSLGRFADSSLGRGLIAYGLSNAMGDDNPLEQALTAGVGRYNAQTADKVYRNQLKQLGMSDEELNNIKGNITKEIFEGVTSGMKLGNQRMTFGQLAQFDEEVAQMVANNPTLANQFIPINYARDVYGRKRDLATTKMEDIKTRSEQNQEKINQGWARIKYLSEKANLNQAEKDEYLRLRNELLKVKIANEGTPRPTKPEKPTNSQPTKKVDYKNKYGLE